MNPLNKATRRKLKAKAHSIHSPILLGKEGFHGGALKAIAQNLKANELIKVKIPSPDREAFQETSQMIAQALPCHLVGTIGRIAIFYSPKEGGVVCGI
jgi:RNA-binding protein